MRKTLCLLIPILICILTVACSSDDDNNPRIPKYEVTNFTTEYKYSFWTQGEAYYEVYVECDITNNTNENVKGVINFKYNAPTMLSYIALVDSVIAPHTTIHVKDSMNHTVVSKKEINSGLKYVYFEKRNY